QIAENEALSALGNEPQLIQNKSPHRRVGRIFRQHNSILGIQIPDVQRRVKDHRAVGQSQRLLHHVKLVVNLADHLFQHILDRHHPHQPPNSPPPPPPPLLFFFHPLHHPPPRLCPRHDHPSAQTSPQVEALQRHAFLPPPLPVLQHP